MPRSRHRANEKRGTVAHRRACFCRPVRDPEPRRGCDGVKVCEVWLGPDGAQTRECSGYIDVRTMHQVEGILVVDGRNAERLSIDDDGAEDNQRDADEWEDSKLLGRPVWCLDALSGMRRRLGKPGRSFLVGLVASSLLHGGKTDSKVRTGITTYWVPKQPYHRRTCSGSRLEVSLATDEASNFIRR